MLVRMKASGSTVDLFDSVARQYITVGLAEEVQKEKPQTAAEMKAILQAENVAGPAGTAGVETAVCTPAMQKAVLTYKRTPRSLRLGR